MKNTKKIIGIIIFFAVICFSMSGLERPKDIEFPPEFRRTWERGFSSDYTNTLTFTSKTVKDSTQNYSWKLLKVSGDYYTIKSTRAGTVYTIYIKYENGKLSFGVDNTSGEHDWQGEWRKL
jgi:hypothetical protein